MDAPNTLEAPISEIHLRALYALLLEVISKNLYGPRFSKQFQVWRQFVHPPGVTDIRTLQGQDGLVVQVNLGDRLGCDIYYGFFQEYCDYALFMALVSADDVVIDVGANYGMYTLGVAKRLGPRGRVIAFEPDARSLVLLEQNVRLNHFERQVNCVGACVGDHDGTTDFFAAIDPSFSGIHDTGRSETSSHLTLPIRTLDSILAELGATQVSLVKIDVEGAEWEVLRGAQQTLANSDPVIMLEISQKNLDDQRGGKLRVELERLESQGFVALWIECENAVSLSRLVLEDALGGIAHKQGAVSTINYFLLKRDSPRFEALQQIFAGLQLDPVKARDEMVKSNVSTVSGKADDASQVVSEIDDTNRFRAMLWAEGVEKQVAIDVCRKMQGEMAGLESKLAESTQELAARMLELNAHMSAEELQRKALTETSAKLAAELEECTACKTKLREAELKNVTLRSSNADYKAMLCQSNEKNSVLMASNFSYKAMLGAKVEQLTAIKTSNANYKAMLGQSNEKISVLKVSNSSYKAMLGAKVEQLAAIKEINANLKAMLEEKGQELAARIEENALFKAKLAKASRELATATSGFIGMLIRIRKQLLARRRRHD